MPSGSFKQADVLCPFYKFDDGKKRSITCEGLIEDSSIVLTYHKKRDYDRQMAVFCCEHYKKCEIHRMLMESKYDT